MTTTPARTAARRWAWPTMGSTASLVIGAACHDPTRPDRWQAAVAAVATWFDEVEQVLSPYRADSDLVRWRSGAARLDECSPLLAEVIDDVTPLPATTHGGFHPYDRHGRYDPTGYVKGWAVERGAAILAEAGVTDACLGIGGDLQTIGRASADRPWRLAVVDPADETRPAAIVSAPGDRFALATSGAAQRGDHIWSALGPGPLDGLDRLGGRPAAAPRLGSISVVGPELRLSDAYATAIWALAAKHPLDQAWEWLAPTDYEALAVLPNGRVRTTAGMAAHLVRPAA